MQPNETLRVLLLCDDRPSHAQTLLDHVAALSQLSAHEVTRINCRGWTSDAVADFDQFDAIVIHYSIAIIYDTYLPPAFRSRVRSFKGVKAIFIQDEYRDVDRYVDAMIDLGVSMLFTCVPPGSIAPIYGRLVAHGVAIRPTLTGYASPAPLAPRPLADRALHLVYRGRPCPFELGDLAREKIDIATRTNALAGKYGLNVDVDWREEARIYGDKWNDFISSGRACLGTESGASIVDKDGSIAEAVAEYRRANPRADYAEVSKAVLRPYEGNIMLNAISPRVFEAVSLRTAMVLFPGAYSGVIEKDRHYIPLEKDFSNFAEVARKLNDIPFLEDLTARTYDELIASGRYSYGRFAAEVDGMLVEQHRRVQAALAERRRRGEDDAEEETEAAEARAGSGAEGRMQAPALRGRVRRALMMLYAGVGGKA